MSKKGQIIPFVKKSEPFIRSRVKLVDKLFLYQKLLIINELKYFYYFVKQYLLMFYKLKTS